MQTLHALETPALILDADRMQRNIARLREHLRPLGVSLRAHLKTAKSIEVARAMMDSKHGSATVSTLKEADEFAAAGVRDMLYAVSITPNKLAHVSRLRQQGVDLTVVLDSVEAAQALSDYCIASGEKISVLIEIDSDGHRSGVRPGDALIVEIAKALQHCELRGVMTHAGASYGSFTDEAKVAMAEQERAAAVSSAQMLRGAGFAAPVVSVGSTPTALYAKSLAGVTEVRAGVYVFFDLVMAGLNVCAVEDVAISVLATVIGHQREKGWIMVDAGWMAMSRDRGTASQPVDQGYGLVCDAQGRVIPDLIMSGANQEHGILSIRAGSSAALPDLPVGSLVRILPNHACATAAQHDAYVVVNAQSDITAHWPRFRGW
ncbi:MAG: DSD1 family PLP-dependent enzyme [Brachymonas sp.]|nr:DSD1 family PLP-dependent enzyme [Brachymonas sp.]